MANSDITERYDPLDSRLTKSVIFILGKGLPVERVPMGLLTKDVALDYTGDHFGRKYPDDISHLRLEPDATLKNYYIASVSPRQAMQSYRMEMCHNVSLLTGKKRSKERAKWNSRIAAYNDYSATRYDTFAQLVKGYVRHRDFSLWVGHNSGLKMSTGFSNQNIAELTLMGLTSEENAAIQSIERLVEQVFNEEIIARSMHR